VPPPPLDSDDERHPRFDRRYADLPPDLLPATESLKDVVNRMLPYWHDRIVPDVTAGRVPLVVAHGNSLRALVMHLDDLTKEQVVELNIPTGIPLVYDLDRSMRPLAKRYLGDSDTALKAAEAVARQAG
jgi:2,3-bisphosphoglycerate-dependent phosphoglycerate mutase